MVEMEDIEKLVRGDRHCTFLGFTNLLGESVPCVIIISAKEDDNSIRAGIIDDLEEVCDENEPFYLSTNMGPAGKKLPGGPRCEYLGKTMPAFVTFDESGSMTGPILKDCLKHMDGLALFDDFRKENVYFLRYIPTPEHHWHVCIGHPYDTSYWQVGDSTEQNGTFKNDLLTKRSHEQISSLSIQPTDIIPLVNKAWDASFARVDSNKKAIAERGWFPYNRALLLHPDIRSTITKQEIEEEKILYWSDDEDDEVEVVATTPQNSDDILTGCSRESRTNNNKPQFDHVDMI